MRKIIAVAGAGLFVLGMAHAEVYKCKKPSGGVEYQDAPCDSGPVEQVNITPSDPKKISEAQAKLAESLKQQAERDAAAAEAAQKEREIAAREAAAAGLYRQANALNRNTQALEEANQARPLYYPYYFGPIINPGPPHPPRPPGPPPAQTPDSNPMPRLQR